MNFAIFSRNLVAPFFFLLLFAMPAGRCSSLPPNAPATSPAAMHAEAIPPIATKASEAIARKKASVVRRMTAGTVELILYLAVVDHVRIFLINVCDLDPKEGIPGLIGVMLASALVVLLPGAPLLFGAKGNTTLVGDLFGTEIVTRSDKAPLSKKATWGISCLRPASARHALVH